MFKSYSFLHWYPFFSKRKFPRSLFFNRGWNEYSYIVYPSSCYDFDDDKRFLKSDS